MSKVFSIACLISSLLSLNAVALSTDVEVIKHYSCEEFGCNSDSSLPSVDIAIHHVQAAEVDWNDLRKQILFAQSAFGAVGVQLRVSNARMIKVPSDWLRFDEIVALGDPKRFKDGLDFYDDVRQAQYSLSVLGKKQFSSIIENSPENSFVIHVITLKDAKLSLYEKNSQGAWEYKSVSTGALSFPPFVFEGRIPKFLRGVITVQAGNKESSLAHELGHKVINVSHEGRSVCPKFSGKNVPGLLGYHGEREIYSGAEGRWHKERLLLSPFVYRVVEGKKVWNPDFKADGRYDDPIYGDFVVKPACP